MKRIFKREPFSARIDRAEKRPSFNAPAATESGASFSARYRAFRQGGLGILDSCFNALYISFSEKSVAREKKKREARGQNADAHDFLELHDRTLRFFSALARRVRTLVTHSLHKKEGALHHKVRFFSTHRAALIIIVLTALCAGSMYVTMSIPVVLRAEINGKTVGVVENKVVLDSAINELEQNVGIILGESYHFPYTVRYTFARQRQDAITDKSRLSEALYAFVSDSICTAAGLYVDDVLVAVCENEEILKSEIAALVAERLGDRDTGVYNDLRIVTQAYPTDSVMGKREFRTLLEEMLLPLEERAKESALNETLRANSVVKSVRSMPAKILVSDVQSIGAEKAQNTSNRPQSIDSIRLLLYRSRVETLEEDIPFATIYQESKSHYTTMADVTTYGKPGRTRVQARIFEVDGVEVRREILQEEVLREPISQVVSLGTKILPEELGIHSPTDPMGLFIMPRIAQVFSGYGERGDGFHRGWDIGGSIGENVYAAASGVVEIAVSEEDYYSNDPSRRFADYGCCVVIRHENGYATLYAHCSRIFVQVGAEVKQGQKIGEIGQTGNAEGPHVHFEVRIGTNRVNPEPYMYKGNRTLSH